MTAFRPALVLRSTFRRKAKGPRHIPAKDVGAERAERIVRALTHRLELRGTLEQAAAGVAHLQATPDEIEHALAAALARRPSLLPTDEPEHPDTALTRMQR